MVVGEAREISFTVKTTRHIDIGLGIFDEKSEQRSISSIRFNESLKILSSASKSSRRRR